MDFLKKNNKSKNLDSKDLKNIEHRDLLSITDLDQLNPEATLTILPSGTRNVLAKSLNLPVDFEECCRYLSNSNSILKVDVIAALVVKDNSENKSKYVYRIFLNAAEIGLGAEIIDKSKLVRDQIGSRLISTVTGVLATLPIYKSNTCEIIESSVENNRISNRLLTKMTMGIVANGSFLGGGFQAATRADVTDGLLDTIVIKNSDSFKILNKLIDVKKGEEAITNENDIYYGQSQTVFWISDVENNITISIDGEPIGILPAYFRVFPQSIRIKL